MQKNTAGQKWRVFAFNRTTLAPVTGDAANITAKIQIDHGAAVATNDVNPTEVESGYYDFDLLQAETNGNILDLIPVSGTADVQVIGVPGRVFTVPPSFQALAVGNLDASVNSRLATAGYTAPDNAGIATAAAAASAAATDAGQVNSRLPANPASEENVSLRLATAGYTAPDNATIAAIEKLVGADWIIDTAVSPWQLVLRERGTAVELLRKNLRDVNGTAITAATQIIGQQLQ